MLTRLENTGLAVTVFTTGPFIVIHDGATPWLIVAYAFVCICLGARLEKWAHQREHGEG